MKEVVPHRMETHINQLFDAVNDFRNKSPKSGSAQMVDLIGEIVSVYDELGQVTLAKDRRIRDTQVRVLYLVRLIKKAVEDRNWDGLSRQTLLYPVVTPS